MLQNGKYILQINVIRCPSFLEILICLCLAFFLILGQYLLDFKFRVFFRVSTIC